MHLLFTARIFDLKSWGVDYPNYGASIAEYPIDTARFRNVVSLVAEHSGWDSPLRARQGRGIAVHRSILTYVAAVARVSVAVDGTPTVRRVDIAVDCGMVENPDRVAAQFEGAVIMSLATRCTAI